MSVSHLVPGIEQQALKRLMSALPQSALRSKKVKAAVAEAERMLGTECKASTGASRHGTDYLYRAMYRPDLIVRDALDALKGVEFDTLVGCGLSGALVVPMLARALRCHFVVVRKDKDGSHSDSRIEGEVGERWLFVDDLICSGHTLKFTYRKLYEALEKDCGQPSKFVGCFFYGTLVSEDYVSARYDSSGQMDYLRLSHHLDCLPTT